MQPSTRTHSFAETVAGWDAPRRAAWIASLSPAMARALPFEWWFWERPGQRPPPPPWRVWLVMAGRGFGKTRVGAEWVRAHAETTRLGRQELEGELIDEIAGALWSRAMLEACRVHAVPPLVRVVVGVDPPAGSVRGAGDACGIVSVGLGDDGKGYVLQDASVSAATPEGWARAVAACAARHGADRVIAEANNGGKMVASVLRAAEAGLPVSLVHASVGKSARAEPVATLYERGAVRHGGAFPALEDELCGLIAGGGYEGPGRSPDRADALVWALTELMLGKRGQAALRML